MNKATAIPAIETFYDGILYRSRTEARFAVFFDVLGVPFQYEAEKFQLENSRYIPDFFLPKGPTGHDSWKGGTFIEIKGAEPDERALERFKEFKGKLRSSRVWANAYLIHGGTRSPVFNDSYQARFGISYVMDQCPFCGWVEVIELGRHWTQGFRCPAAVEILERYNIEDFYLIDIEHRQSPMIALAWSAANSARFESPDIKEIVATYRRATVTLFENGVYCHPLLWSDLSRGCEELAVDPRCPKRREPAA